jgi:hypothetical protein
MSYTRRSFRLSTSFGRKGPGEAGGLFPGRDQIGGKRQQVYLLWKKSTEKYNKNLDEKFRQIVLGIEQITKEDEET